MTQTPIDLFEQTGAQQFLALFPVADDNIISRRYYMEAFIAAPQGVMLISMYSDLFFSDLDSDGRTEILQLVPGPTSGVCTFTLSAYEIVDDTPVIDGSTILGPVKWADYSLKEQDGKVYLSADSKGTLYPVSLSQGTIHVEGLEGWGEFTGLETQG